MGMYQYKEVPKSFERFWAAEEMAEIEGRSLLKRFCSDKLKKERLRGVTAPSEFDLRNTSGSVMRSINAALLKQTIKSRPYIECVNTPMKDPDVKFIDVKKSVLTICLISPPMKMTKEWIQHIYEKEGSSISVQGDQLRVNGRYVWTAVSSIDKDFIVKSLDPISRRQYLYLPKWAVTVLRYIRMLNRLAIVNAVPVHLSTSTVPIFDEDYNTTSDSIAEGSIIRLNTSITVHLLNNVIHLDGVRSVYADFARTPLEHTSLTRLKELAGDKWASPRFWTITRGVTSTADYHSWEEEDYRKYFMSERALLFIPQLRVIFNTLARLTSYGPSVFEVGTGKCSVQISGSEDDESPALSSEA